MSGSNPQNFLLDRKLENHFFQSWIFAKQFERLLIFSLFHTFGHFEKCSADHWKKCVVKFQKSKIWDVHFFSFFRARRHCIWLFSNIQTCLVVNWARKWSVFDFWKKSEISQKVLQESMTEKNDFIIFGRVKSFVGPSPSFCTPNFLLGGSRKGCTFMIAFDHKLIFLIIGNAKWMSSTS